MKYTHKGWFFLCPVYLNPEEGEGMAVDARWPWLDWWFSVNESFFGLTVCIMTVINPEYEPMFPFRVTGEVNKDINP